MQYSLLGNTGLLVSRLAFGAMTFKLSAGGTTAIAKVDERSSDDLISAALDAGVNFFDTADLYSGGDSEVLLGQALQGKRNEVVIATKVGFRSGPALTQTGLSRRHIVWSVDQSLRRLGSDWIDVYILHTEDPHTPIEETLGALDDVVRAGKVRYLGFSNWSAWKVSAALEMQKANSWAPFTHGQMNYSLLARDIERDVIPMLTQYGLGLTVWSPLAGGFLSGKYTRENLKDPAHRLSGFDVLPADKEQGFKLIERLREIAANHGGSIAQVALAWLLAKSQVTSILLGANKLSQLEDNLAALELELTPDELAELDAATELPVSYPNWFLRGFADKAVAEALSQNRPHRRNSV